MFQLWIAKCVGLMFTSASQLKSIYRACRLSVTYHRFGCFFAAFAKIEGSPCLWWLMTAYLSDGRILGGRRKP
jgi:hypothetical protein